MAMAYGFGHGFGFGLGFLNFLGTILFFVTVVAVARFVLRGGRRGRPWGCGGAGWSGGSWRRASAADRGWTEGTEREGAAEPEDARRIARERLARGDIDRAEYDSLRAALDADAWQRSPGRPPFERWFGREPAPDPLEVARLRLARGELSIEAYRELRAALLS